MTGTFTAGRLRVAVEDGRLLILDEGAVRKFVREVEHRTFSGEYAVKREQPVLYVTERCVFRLTARGMELTEIAPSIDLERDILARMDFVPVMDAPPRLMDERIFQATSMGLREEMLTIPLAERLVFDPEQNIFFVNFEGLNIRRREAIEEIRLLVQERLVPLGRKVLAIVNYDNFSIEPEIIDAYTDMVRGLVDRYYSGVTRYTTSGFTRIKLGDALTKRSIVPHIYESAAEARARLQELEKRGG